MNFKTSSAFQRQLRERSSKSIREAYRNKVKIFLKNPYDLSLDNHELEHEWKGYRSFDVTDDYRVIFKKSDRETYLFYAFGNHDQLYWKWRK